MITVETIRLALLCDNPACECHAPNRNVHCPAHKESTGRSWNGRAADISFKKVGSFLP